MLHVPGEAGERTIAAGADARADAVLGARDDALEGSSLAVRRVCSFALALNFRLPRPNLVFEVGPVLFQLVPLLPKFFFRVQAVIDIAMAIRAVEAFMIVTAALLVLRRDPERNPAIRAMDN